jgi:co-chaperonin GroES (HSP10)
MSHNALIAESLVPRDSLADWEPLLARITPMSKRIIITKPKVQEISESRTIIVPDSAKKISKEFGLEATVLKRANDVIDAIQVGDRIIIPEFAGTPIVIGVEVPFWMVGEGDVMLVFDAHDFPTKDDAP